MTLAKWTDDLGDFADYWTIVPGDLQLQTLAMSRMTMARSSQLVVPVDGSAASLSFPDATDKISEP